MSVHQELNKRDVHRDREIIRLRKAGWGLRQIGDKLALTKQRIHQCVVRLKREGKL